jgi:hypothetical protein
MCSQYGNRQHSRIRKESKKKTIFALFSLFQEKNIEYKVGMPVDLHVTSVKKEAKVIALSANPKQFRTVST